MEPRVLRFSLPPILAVISKTATAPCGATWEDHFRRQATIENRAAASMSPTAAHGGLSHRKRIMDQPEWRRFDTHKLRVMPQRRREHQWSIEMQVARRGLRDLVENTCSFVCVGLNDSIKPLHRSVESAVDQRRLPSGKGHRVLPRGRESKEQPRELNHSRLFLIPGPAALAAPDLFNADSEAPWCARPALLATRVV